MKSSVLKKKSDLYGFVLLILILVITAVMSLAFNQIKDKSMESSTPVIQSHLTFRAPTYLQNQKIYILSSSDTASFYSKHGSSAQNYAKSIKNFEIFLSKIGFDVSIVSIDSISSLPPESLLFLLDAQVLSNQDKNSLLNFIEEGGSLFFNFTAGFNDTNNDYLGDNFVSKITKLKLSPKGFAQFKSGLSFTPRLLSPINEYLKEGKWSYVPLYDKIPIYNTRDFQKADLFMTNYSQTSAPMAKGVKDQLSNSESGLIWHGYLGRGKWIYSSLPSYSFYDSDENQNEYAMLLSGMIKFLKDKAIARAFPYIDAKSLVFVSEDTEYKFENFQRFADLAYEYRVPVTAFIVAGLAKLPEHKQMMHKIAKNRFVEFASHSTSHKKIIGMPPNYVKQETIGSKKIIDRYAPQPIIGFRPPREELDLLMKRYLTEGGFAYILGETKSYLYPTIDKDVKRLYFMPRHGTDDYTFLVNLDWDQKQIVQQIINEAEFVHNLDGIYTLSVHTHLFSYSSNINIIRSFFKYLKSHPYLKPLQGRQIIRRVDLYKHMSFETLMSGDELKIIVTNKNQTPVKNLHFQLFKNPNISIAGGQVEGANSVKVDVLDDEVILDRLAPHSKTVVSIKLRG